MCLTINTKKDNEKDAIDYHKKTNGSTITVYKILSDKLKSLHQSYQYNLDMHYYQVKDKKTDKFGFGFTTGWKNGLSTLRIHQGLHAFTSLKRAKNSLIFGQKIVKCIIPKGAEYFIDRENHEIVTDNLITKCIMK